MFFFLRLQCTHIGRTVFEQQSFGGSYASSLASGIAKRLYVIGVIVKQLNSVCNEFDVNNKLGDSHAHTLSTYKYGSDTIACTGKQFARDTIQHIAKSCNLQL